MCTTFCIHQCSLIMFAMHVIHIGCESLLEIMNPHVARYEREGHLRHRHGELVRNVARTDTLAMLGYHGIKSKVEKLSDKQINPQ